jgi:CP family cyanate transporter-like MFS transporter
MIGTHAPRPVAGAPPALHPVLLGVALVLLAVNLRTTVGSLPPLLTHIERDLRISGAVAGLLTALPVVCMAWAAPAAHRVAHRYGREATALASVVLVAVGNGLRLEGMHAPALFGGTLLAGLGIAACGVVLPGIVKEFFPGRAGAASSAYTVAMMLGAGAAGALAVPLEDLLGSWTASLAAWALPAAMAAAVWVPVTARLNEHESEEESHPGRLPLRSTAAWLLAIYMSAQASLAYAYMGWLSPAYESHGWSAGRAGVLFGMFNLVQFVTAAALPAVADRFADRRPVIVFAVTLTSVGAVWLWAFPEVLPWVAVCVAALGIGGGFALGLVLIVDYAAGPSASGRLAAMVFLVCYTAAAVTPVVVGALRDATGGFGLPFGLLTLLAVAQLALATRLRPEHRGTVA